MGGYNQIQDYNSDTKQRVSPEKNILVFSLLALLLISATVIFLYRYIRGIELAKANQVLFPKEKIKKREKPEVSYKMRLRHRINYYNRELSDISYKKDRAQKRSEKAEKDYIAMQRFYNARVKNQQVNNGFSLTNSLKEYYKGKPVTKERLEKVELESIKYQSEYEAYRIKAKSLKYKLGRTKGKLGHEE